MLPDPYVKTASDAEIEMIPDSLRDRLREFCSRHQFRGTVGARRNLVGMSTSEEMRAEAFAEGYMIALDAMTAPCEACGIVPMNVCGCE